jgi:hypothetical protein
MNTESNFKDYGDFYISCPHCDDIVYITKVKCTLFLHAYNAETNKALNPHTKWFKVDKLRRDGKLLGCGGRFKIIKNINGICSIQVMD